MLYVSIFTYPCKNVNICIRMYISACITCISSWLQYGLEAGKQSDELMARGSRERGTRAPHVVRHFVLGIVDTWVARPSVYSNHSCGLESSGTACTLLKAPISLQAQAWRACRSPQQLIVVLKARAIAYSQHVQNPEVLKSP